MKLVELQYAVDSLWSFKENIIFKKGKVFSNLEKRGINLENYKRIYYSEEYIFGIIKENIEIYNLDFQNIATFQVDSPVGIVFLDGISNYVIRCGKNEEDYLFYRQNIFVKYEQNVMGRLLNSKFRLHFQDPFSSPTYFRCSDLLDELTYWEYEVIDSEKQIGSFILYEDRLIFYTQEVDKESYDSRFWLNVLDIKNGEQVYHISCKNHSACFDSERGLFIAVQGANQHGETPKTYEIININTGERIFEEFYHDLFFYAVGVTYSVLDNHFLYFTDSPVKHGDTYVFDTPRIGCFDYLAKKLLYFKEIPEMKEKGIKQFVVKGDRFYFRTPENELFIFEDQNETV